MSAYYQCIICHHANISIMDLHNHHVQHHNAIELSQTIINLNGFKLYSDIGHMKQQCIDPISIGDNNNNGDLHDHVFIKPKLKDHGKYRSKEITTSPRKFSHDKATCLTNCSQFIFWEQELNKRTEINDEEFFNITESLCCDLSKRKSRGRKKKHKTDINKIDAKNVVQHIETKNIKDITNTENQMNIDSIQAPTSSFWNSSHAISNTVTTDEILPIKTEPKIEISMETKPEHSENDEIFTTMPLTETTDKNKDTVTPNSLYNDFSWSSIIFGNLDEQDVSAEEENIYTASMEPTFENLLS